MALQILRDRLVGFFDVLGFSQALATRSLDSLHSDFAAVIDAAEREVFQADGSTATAPLNFAWHRFVFDSVVVVSRPLDEEHAASAFVLAICDLLRNTFEKQMPLRGAVGLGNFGVDEKRGVFLSEIIPTLHDLQQSQQWSGAIINPRHCDEIVSLVHSAGNSLGSAASLVEYEAPMKTGPIKTSCFNWPVLLDRPGKEAGLRFLNEEKRPSTEAFVSHVLAMGPNPQRLAEELAPATTYSMLAAGLQLKLTFRDRLGRRVDPARGAALQVGRRDDSGRIHTIASAELPVPIENSRGTRLPRKKR